MREVNAALATQILIDSYGVNVGVAGGIDEAVQRFDTVVSTETAYHDVAEDILMDFHPWLPSIYFPAGEMLLAAAHVCYVNRVPFLAARRLGYGGAYRA